MPTQTRCPWCGDDPVYMHYHDTEWGVPDFDDRRLFAKLILDGAQAGLSWITILRKRDGYYKAFDNFNAEKMARYDQNKFKALMQNPEIVRNRLKIQSAIKNARGYLEIMEKKGSFSAFIWDVVDGRPIHNQWQAPAEVPTETPESKQLSKALKHHGFSFVGPTIIYAFMQAVGLVNDHLVNCHRHDPCFRLGTGQQEAVFGHKY